jgi:hypothetical protein
LTGYPSRLLFIENETLERTARLWSDAADSGVASKVVSYLEYSGYRTNAVVMAAVTQSCPAPDCPKTFKS